MDTAVSVVPQGTATRIGHLGRDGDGDYTNWQTFSGSQQDGCIECPLLTQHVDEIDGSSIWTIEGGPVAIPREEKDLGRLELGKDAQGKIPEITQHEIAGADDGQDIARRGLIIPGKRGEVEPKELLVKRIIRRLNFQTGRLTVMLIATAGKAGGESSRQRQRGAVLQDDPTKRLKRSMRDLRLQLRGGGQRGKESLPQKADTGDIEPFGERLLGDRGLYQPAERNRPGRQGTDVRQRHQATCLKKGLRRDLANACEKPTLSGKGGDGLKRETAFDTMQHECLL